MINEIAKTTVIVDGKQAEQELKDLTEKSKQLRNQLTEMRKQKLIDPSEMARVQKELKNTESAIRSMKKEAFDVSKVMKNLSGASLKDLQKAAGKLSAEMKNLSRNTAEYAAKAKQLSAVKNEMSKVKGEMNGVAKGMQKVSSSAQSFSSSITSFINPMTIAISAFSAVLVKSIQVFAGFQNEMQKQKAILGATDEQFKSLTENAQLWGSTTEYTAQQIAELQTNLAKGGLNVDQIKATTGAIVDLGTATQEDLSKAAETVTGILGSYQLAATESARVTDVMSYSFNNSKLNLERFTNASKFSATTAKAAGVEFEQLAAMQMILADNMIVGSQAGTSLRRIFSQMAATGKPAAEAFKEMTKNGITLAGANDEVGLTAQTALNILSVNQDKIIARTIELQQKAIGSTAKTAQMMRDTLLGDFARFQSAAEGVMLEIGTALAPAMSKVTNLLIAMFANAKPLKDVFSSMFSAIEEVGGEFAKLAQSLGITTDKTSAASGIMKVWSVILKATLLPLRAIIKWISIFVEGVNFGIRVIKFIVNAFKIFVSNFPMLKSFFTGIQKIFTGFINLIRNIPKYLNGMVAGFSAAFSAIKDTAINMLGNIGDLIIGLVTFDKDKILASLSGLKKAFTEGGANIGNAFMIGFNNAVAAPEIKVDATVEDKIVAPITKGFEEVEQSQTIKNVASGAPAADNIASPIEETTQDDAQVKADAELEKQKLIDDALIEQKEEFIAKIAEMTEADNVSEIDKTRLKYEELIRQAEEYGISAVDIISTMNKQIAEIEAKNAIERLQNYENTFGAIGQLLESAGGDLKIFTAGKIALDTAQSISALMAVAEANPLNTLTFGGAGIIQWISGIARITQNVVTAKKFLSESGFYSGGFTKPGSKYQPAGIVHAGEYVIPQEGLQNNTIRSIVSTIEQSRKAGTLRQFDMESSISNIRKVKGYAEGGYTSAPPIENFDSGMSNSINQLNNTLANLQTNGIQGVWEWERYKSGKNKMETIDTETSK